MPDFRTVLKLLAVPVLFFAATATCAAAPAKRGPVPGGLARQKGAARSAPAKSAAKKAPVRAAKKAPARARDDVPPMTGKPAPKGAGPLAPYRSAVAVDADTGRRPGCRHGIFGCTC